MIHFKALKWIFQYIKSIVDFGLFYEYFNSFDLMSYNDSDWAGDMDDRNSTTGFVFFIEDIIFTCSSKKQSMVILSTCETEYVAIKACICHSIWLIRLLKKLWMPQEKSTKIYVDNSSVNALTKNPVFHDRSKHFDTRFHYLRDFITNKEVEVKYVKTQYQVANIFTKPLKYDVFTKIRDLLGVMKKSNLRGGIEN